MEFFSFFPLSQVWSIDLNFIWWRNDLAWTTSTTSTLFTRSLSFWFFWITVNSIVLVMSLLSESVSFFLFFHLFLFLLLFEQEFHFLFDISVNIVLQDSCANPSALEINALLEVFNPIFFDSLRIDTPKPDRTFLSGLFLFRLIFFIWISYDHNSTISLLLNNNRLNKEKTFL